MIGRPKTLTGRLRYGRAHRETARINLKNARPVHVLAVATVGGNICVSNAAIDATEAIGDCRDRLRRWCERSGVLMMTLSGRAQRTPMTRQDPFGESLLVGMIVEMRGTVPTLPCTIEGWRLQVATGQEIEAYGLMHTTSGLKRRPGFVT